MLCNPESNLYFCNPYSIILFILALIGVAIVFCFLYIKKYQAPEAEVDQPQEEPTQVEKELIKLGFADFSVMSAIKYFGLNQRLQFEIIAKYTDGSFKINIKLPNNLLVPLELYSDGANIRFYEERLLTTPEILFIFDDSVERIRIDTDHGSAKQVLKNVNWRRYLRDAEEVEIYLSHSEFVRLNK